MFRGHVAVGACDGGAAALDLRVGDGAEVDEVSLEMLEVICFEDDV